MEDNSYTVKIMEQNGWLTIIASEVPRDLAEKILVSYFFDSYNSHPYATANPAEWPRVSIETQPWRLKQL